MFSTIRLKFGSSPNKPELEIPSTSLTIFVGPNNSGKSQILREILAFCGQGGTQRTLILKEITLASMENTDDEIQKYIPRHLQDVEQNANTLITVDKGYNSQISLQDLQALFEAPNSQIERFCELFLRHNKVYLDGSNRLQMVNSVSMGGPHGEDNLFNPTSNLAILFTNDIKRRKLRKIIFEAFGKYFAIDPTLGGRLSIKLSNVEPPVEIERSLTDAAFEFHRNNLPIESTSDGVKAFIGILISLIAGDHKVIAIDEPEAFLHPSLSFKLGKEVGNILRDDLSKRVFVATHSASFLMGCIQSGTPINIVRLTYSNNVPTARHLSNEKIVKLMRNPLLRSVGVLNGLFYEYVIVTEGNSDRAFYQEINERLLAFTDKGIENCLFLEVNGKDSIYKVMKPLREMGIPCAAIVDIDVLKNGGTNWANFLGSAFVPDGTRRELETSRNFIMEKFNRKAVDFKRNGGVNVLDEGDKESANNLINRLEEYGIFLVRKGEVESWLEEFDVSRSKERFLTEIFEKLGEDPNSPDYIRPSEGDVWDFIPRIKSWFVNPNRKGIPE